MDIAGTVINAAVVAAVGITLARLGKGKFDDIDKRFERVDGRFEQVDKALAEVNRRIDGLHANVLTVALAVGAHPEPRAEEA